MRSASRNEHVVTPTLARHIDALDGLRGVAILLVLWFHYYGPIQSRAVLPIDSWVVRFVNTGWIGVDLFFVLSGFLITGILYDAKNAACYFRTFYARRALRIFPLYYGFLFLMLVLIPLVHPYRQPALHQTMQDQGWLWLYGTNIAQTFFNRPLTGFTPMWSLAVEEHFYLVWPIVVYLLSRRQLIVTCLLLVPFALLMRIALESRGFWPAVFTLCRVDSLALGGLVAVLARGDGGLSKYRTGAGVLAAVCFAVLVYVFWTAPGQSGDDVRVRTFGYSVVAVFMASMLLLVVAPGSLPRLSRMLGAAPLRSIGKYSYAMYIFHWTLIPPLASLFHRFDLRMPVSEGFISQLPFAIASTVICYLLAVASWHLYEKHFLKLKRHFEYSAGRSRGRTVHQPDLATLTCASELQ